MNERNRKLLEKARKQKQKQAKKNSALMRHKKKKRKELLIIFAIIFFIVASISFMFSPFVKLKNINVSGYDQLSSEEILQAGNINSNLKTWTIKDSEVEDNIKAKFNIIKNVTVKSKMLSKIDINVEEYKLIAKNKKDDGSYEIILENGDVYQGVIKNSYNLPILEQFSEDGDKRAEVYKNIVQLKQEIINQISEIVNDKDNKETITIYMKDGQKIKALSANFAEKLNFYDEMSSYIKDKDKVVLNLINGAYVETNNSVKEKQKKINDLLSQVGEDTSGTHVQNENSIKQESTTSENTEVKNNNSTATTTNSSNQNVQSTQTEKKQATTKNTVKKKYTP